MKNAPISGENKDGIRWRNKNGDLSAYSFLCGYVQERTTATHYKKIYMEHSHYHVMSGKIGDRFTIWGTYDADQLTQARKQFKNIKLPTQ